MAASRPPAAERESGLRRRAAPARRRRRGRSSSRAARSPAPTGTPGTGTATVVERPAAQRVLTFTEFDVDPGVDVDVFLSASPEDIDDRIELGDLKGNVGDQQYEIPADADLRSYSNVVLWCNPFTVRIAVAELAA